METKICTKCGERKPLNQFYKHKAVKDGRRPDCKQCIKKYTEKNKESRRMYAEKHRKENTQKVREKDRLRYLERKEEVIQYQKEYREENKEAISNQRRKYRQTDRGRKLVYNSWVRRRSYKQKVKFTSFEREQILDRDNWTCKLCGCKVHDRSTGNWNTPDKAHLDHIIPISKGGNSEPNNLQVLCRTCNLKKADKQLTI